MESEIVVKINKKTGAMSMEAFGYSGGQCTQDIDAISNAIGAMTLESQPKDEIVENIAVQRIGL